jgi:hypothetical protein
MRPSTGTHVNLNRPGSPGVAVPPPRLRPSGTSPGWQGLMDTTSNLGRGADSDCAPTGCASRIPTMSRTDRASWPDERVVFPKELSLSTLLSMRQKPGASRYRSYSIPQWGSTSLPHSRPSSRKVGFPYITSRLRTGSVQSYLAGATVRAGMAVSLAIMALNILSE